jgi:hypothetical protein
MKKGLDLFNYSSTPTTMGFKSLSGTQYLEEEEGRLNFEMRNSYLR